MGDSNLTTENRGNMVLDLTHESDDDDADEKTANRVPSECANGWALSRGPVNAFDLGEAGLLIRPVKPPTAEEVNALLAQTPAGKQSPAAAAALVARALKKVRGQ